jgi:heterodisulfide reductase subunit C
MSSEGNFMEEWLYPIFKRHNLCCCIECGKCVSVCPMQDIFRGFDFEISPRGVIKKAALGLDILKDDTIWFCLECNACTDACPAGVEYRDFIIAARNYLVAHGNEENTHNCERCGRYFSTRHISNHIKNRLKGGDSDYINVCPDCRETIYLAKIRDTFHTQITHKR